jgi:DNA end-binding protein Ku
MLRDKQAGRDIKAPKEAKPSNVINLMDALRRSIESDKGGKVDKSEEPEQSSPSRRPAAKSKTRGTKKSVAQKPAKKRARG